MIIQLLGFTLATKQPAMTASSLALHMSVAKNAGDFTAVLDNLTALIRSQVASVIGNVLGVVPWVWGMYVLLDSLLDFQLISHEHALEIINEHRLLSYTPLYAIFTGFLLWLSSILAGFLENWSAYRQLAEVLSQLKPVVRLLGLHRAQCFAQFMRRHMALIVSNISLAALLILAPAVLGAMGLALDIRHVAISSGIVAYAVLSLENPLGVGELVSLICSCLLIGGLNVFVSFTLSFTMSSRMCGLSLRERRMIYRAMNRAFFRKPLSFLLPNNRTSNGNDDQIKDSA